MSKLPTAILIWTICFFSNAAFAQLEGRAIVSFTDNSNPKWSVHEIVFFRYGIRQNVVSVHSKNLSILVNCMPNDLVEVIVEYKKDEKLTFRMNAISKIGETFELTTDQDVRVQVQLTEADSLLQENQISANRRDH